MSPCPLELCPPRAQLLPAARTEGSTHRNRSPLPKLCCCCLG
ncbi:rCG57006, isoform CRA_a [Rattus norvegicus]|uniref:RCG57006, isoform CRA_a n=1 Tax=Rattus norvegicus TaxID=10116 RepID=A6JD24_RAT|nr:rCG57006, isoform CRA_a [Rattus norvegicus]